MTLQYTVLHLEIARCVIYPRQQKYWQNVRWSIQDGRPNSGTSICKINILALFLWNNTPSYAKPFISKAKLISNTKVLKWTLHLHLTSCFWPKCQKKPNGKFVILFKMMVCVFGKASSIQFINLALPISGLAALIRECKLNWYSSYGYSENRQPRTLTSIVQIITRKKRTYGIVQCTCMT